jgi:hypothetical protein
MANDSGDDMAGEVLASQAMASWSGSSLWFDILNTVTVIMIGSSAAIYRELIIPNVWEGVEANLRNASAYDVPHAG